MLNVIPSLFSFAACAIDHYQYSLVKLRGIARGDMVDKDFFIILDRLHQTLDERIKDWLKSEKKFKGSVFGLGKNRNALRDLMVDRMTVAYDIAAALFYLHENRCVGLCLLACTPYSFVPYSSFTICSLSWCLLIQMLSMQTDLPRH